MGDAQCLKWGEETRKECSEYRDEGYEACEEWDSKCCTWWPCSWGCKLLTWFCVSWYWVSNVVCVAWTWVTAAVCLVWAAVIAVVGVIVDVVSVVVGAVVGAIGVIVDLIFSIPILGSLLKQLWHIIQELVYRFLGLLDALAWVIGIRPEKRLRMCVIVLRDQRGPVVDPARVLEEVQAAIDIFRDQAHVRLLPSTAWNVSTAFNDDEAATDDFLHVLDAPSADDILDVHCGLEGYGEEWGIPGSKFNLLMTTHCFWGNWRRLLGYGAPIVVFVVRSIEGASGCSMGPLTDYVVVEGPETTDKTTIAHETGHACGLWHTSTMTNLMFGTDNNARRNMTNWQAINFRNSRHVTYV